MKSYKNRAMLVLAISAFSLAFAVPGYSYTGQSKAVPYDVADEVHNSFIFVFKDHVAPAEVKGKANLIARSQGGRVTHTYKHSIKGFAAKMPPHAAARVAANNPNIAYYEPDGVMQASKKPDRPGKPGNGGGGEDPVSPPDCNLTDREGDLWGIKRVGGFSDGTGSTAWVIDSGIDLDHPDLNVDTSRSANFARGKSANDGNGHGTHVAGTIAAIDNGCGVVGVAAGAAVVAVRVLNNNGSGSYSGVIAGIDYVADNAAVGDVANMSLGGGRSTSVNNAVSAAAAKGILFALAAGNESADADEKSPASTNGNNIFTVSAIDSSDKFASFSNYGNPPVDCAAPGVNILSLYKDGGMATLSGTSMAAPHVAGMLLVSGLPVSTDGSAIDDPDNNPDPVCSEGSLLP